MQRVCFVLWNAEYHKQKRSHIPESIQDMFHDSIDQNGFASLGEIRKILSKIPDQKEREDILIKERLIYLLEHAQYDINDFDDVTSKLEEYENALAVNKSGYRPYYKRDIAETMVNTYNAEWIAAWNGNMDIQLCLDFFAVITYISDYYSKDDSGTMELLLNALKDVENQDLKTKLRTIQSVFLTQTDGRK